MREYITPEHFAIAKSNGISQRNLTRRVYIDGWSINRAITQPIKKHNFTQEQLKKFYALEYSREQIHYYFKKYKTFERAYEIALKNKNKPKRIFSDEQKEIILKSEIPYARVYQRVFFNGWSFEDATTIPTLDKTEIQSFIKEKRNVN